MAKLNLWLAFGKRRGNDTLHWILILARDGAETGTYYHVTGGPTRGKSYTLEIQDGKRVNSNGISEHHFIGEIDEKDRNKLKASTQKIPVQRCQEWTVGVLGDLERKSLAPPGTRDHWYKRIENSPYSTDGVHGTASGAASSSSKSGQNPQAGKGSSSTAQKSSSKDKTQDASDWVWDELQQEYRYWNGQRWVWESESGQQ